MGFAAIGCMEADGGHRRRRRPNPGGGTIHWDGTDECRWSVASVVALVLATKGLISGSFGLAIGADFAQKVQYLSCGGSLYTY